MGCASFVTLWRSGVSENEYSTKTVFISIPPHFSTTIYILLVRKSNLKIHLAKPKTKNDAKIQTFWAYIKKELEKMVAKDPPRVIFI